MQSIFKTLPTLALLIVLLTSTLLSGCISTPKVDDNAPEFADILGYEASLDKNHSNSAATTFYLSEAIRETVRREFASSSKHRSARKLAQWLMRPDGHNMQYDISANLNPAQAYEQGRANCLSFSLLLIELASELDIKLQLNQVDLPDIWGEDELEDLVFYRHVNVVYKSSRHTQIFDLALEEYRPGFPQRIISKHHGRGLLYSNLGIQELQSGRLESALHYLKLSVSIFPQNADMWINLGAAFKRDGDLAMAEKIYLKAFSINDQNSLAASNLERIYRSSRQNSKANYFEKHAKKARQRNPYLQYRLAQKAFDQGSYKIASKAIKRAIRLHNKDPKFFELSSRIRQTENNYVAALKDIHKAYQLSQQFLQRGRYAHKVEMIIARAKAYNSEKEARRKRSQGYEIIDVETYRNAGQTF